MATADSPPRSSSRPSSWSSCRAISGETTTAGPRRARRQPWPSVCCRLPGHPVQVQGGHLVDGRLAVAGGHHGEDVAALRRGRACRRAGRPGGGRGRRCRRRGGGGRRRGLCCCRWRVVRQLMARQLRLRCRRAGGGASVMGQLRRGGPMAGCLQPWNPPYPRPPRRHAPDGQPAQLDGSARGHARQVRGNGACRSAAGNRVWEWILTVAWAAWTWG